MSGWTLDSCTLAGAERPRLDAIDGTITAPVTAILGISGAGKSSLLGLLCGFHQPTAGRIERPGGVAWMPGDLGLWEALSILDHGRLVGASPAAIADGAERLGLELPLRTPVARCSQGQRARVALLRALLSPAGYLVLDEPLAHVAAIDAARCEDWILEAVAAGRQLVVATHDPAWCLRHADQVWCLDEGRLLAGDQPQALYRRRDDPLLASLLGPVVAIDAVVAGWLSRPELAGAQLRPEELDLVPGDASASVWVDAHQVVGAVARSTLSDGRHQRVVEHRPRPSELPAGTRVVLSLASLMMLVFLFGGCDGGGQLPFSSVETVPVSRVGATRPAPRALSFDGELIWALDTAGRVLAYRQDGSEDRSWPMPASDVGKPEGVLRLADGRVAVADTHYHRVLIFSATGQELDRWGSSGRGPGHFIYPIALAQAPDGGIYVGEYGGNDRIQLFSPEGQFRGQFGSFGTAPGQFQRPGGLAVRDGIVYVSDAFNNRIQCFTLDGTFRGVFAPGVVFDYPYDCAFDQQGRLWVVEYGAARVSCLTVNGSLVGRFGRPGRESGTFSTPWGMTPAGSGRLWVADTGNRRMVVLTP